MVSKGTCWKLPRNFCADFTPARKLAGVRVGALVRSGGVFFVRGRQDFQGEIRLPELCELTAMLGENGYDAALRRDVEPAQRRVECEYVGVAADARAADHLQPIEVEREQCRVLVARDERDAAWCVDEQAVRMRAGLRQRMEGSPLMDAPGFVRALEAAYRMMWRSWCARNRITEFPKGTAPGGGV